MKARTRELVDAKLEYWVDQIRRSRGADAALGPYLKGLGAVELLEVADLITLSEAEFWRSKLAVVFVGNQKV